MTVKSVVGERRFAVLAGEPDLGGVDAHALLLVRMELSLRKGREVVVTADGSLTVHLTVEDRTDSLVMHFGRPDGSSSSGFGGPK